MRYTTTAQQNPITYYDRIKDLSKAGLQILGGSLLIALLAKVKIPLFFTPIPLSLQTFAIMLIAGSLGKIKGTLAVLAYLIEASFGIPVLTGASSSFAKCIGPSGGYFAGFLMQAYLTGWYLETKKELSQFSLFIGLEIISLAVLAMGSLWLACYVGWNHAFMLGFAPFIIGDILKAFCASFLLIRNRKSCPE